MRGHAAAAAISLATPARLLSTAAARCRARPIRALSGAVVALVLGGLLGPASASAHGPCDCLVPMLGAPREKVTLPRIRAYKVVFNPRPVDYGSAMRDVGYHSAYQPEAPSKTVVLRPQSKPARRLTFHVPNAPPGVYLVLIFDGTEGGTHATWAYYHVLGRPPEPRKRATASTGALTRREPDVDSRPPGLSGGVELLGIAAAVAGCVFLGYSLGVSRRDQPG